MPNFFGIPCPRCGDEDGIDIESTIWLITLDDELLLRVETRRILRAISRK